MKYFNLRILNGKQIVIAKSTKLGICVNCKDVKEAQRVVDIALIRKGLEPIYQLKKV